MKHSQGLEKEGIKKGGAKDLSHNWKTEDCRRLKISLECKLPGRALGFWAMRALLLVVVFEVHTVEEARESHDNHDHNVWLWVTGYHAFFS